jgi:hypothetical protein
MIRYRLTCDKAHEFEAWFSNAAAYDAQAGRRQLSCPACGSTSVEKALMAPSVIKTPKGARKKAPAQAAAMAPEPAGKEAQPVAAHHELVDTIRKLRAKSEYVGRKFSEEARKIHHEEAPARGIHGEATPEEAEALSEEGIEFFPLPILPEDHN